MDTNSTNPRIMRGRLVGGKLTAILVLAALVGAVGAGTSFAGSNQSTPTCAVPAANAQPFLHWNDHGSYFLAPGGTFESSQSLQGWSTSGSVKLVSGNEKWYVHSYSDSRSLQFAPGSSATSPAICVNVHSPVMRFFMQSSGWSSSHLDVTLNYTDKYGYARTASLGAYSAGSAWSLSPQIAFLNYIAPVVGGQGQTSVSFTFSVPSGSSTGAQIDDFYVDPLKST
jgi:hypothetical protein